MAELPILSSKEVIKILEKLGYEAVRQKGSHIRLININKRDKPTTVPNTKTIRKGLLRKIMRDVGIEPEDFLNLK